MSRQQVKRHRQGPIRTAHDHYKCLKQKMFFNKLPFLGPFLIGLSLAVDAQVVDNTICTNMQPICTSDEYKFDSTGNGKLLPNEQGNFYGCLYEQPGPRWYFLEIDDPGLIKMNLWAPNDIDFIVSTITLSS